MRDKNKYKQFHIYLLKEDWEKILKRAEICKTNPTAFIREIALRGEIKLYNNERLNELSLQLCRIGKNINEIVKLAQTVKNVNETDIENLEKHMKRIDEAISDWCKPFKYEVI
jgi:hypothetical protein